VAEEALAPGTPTVGVVSSKRPPRRVAAKHELAAFLLASNKFSAAEVAERTGLPEPRLVEWVEGWPDFQALVEDFQGRFAESGSEEVTDALKRDFPANLRFLQDARAGNLPDSDKIMALRLRAALALLEKQVPKQSGEGEAPGVTIVINQEQTERFRKARAEVVEFDEAE